MKREYVITNEELSEKGLNLNDYALDGTFVEPIINRGLDICITRICFLCDNVESEEEIESFLQEHKEKVKVFKKLQFNILWNLIFMGNDTPIDSYIDNIISHELNIGKVNGIQKGLYWGNR